MRLLTAVLTPFEQDGSLALDVIPAYADQLASWGCAGVYVGGTAGEGASMTTAERQLVLERWCEVADGRFQVIAHVGHTSLPDAQALAAHAQEVGAGAISAVPPYFFKTNDVNALIDFFARLTAVAPDLPLIYYHIPSVTGVSLPASSFMAAAQEKISTFGGVKFADGDLADFQRCLDRAEDGQEVYVGNAKLALAAVAVGARAAIGSVYNYAAPLFRSMFAQLEAGDADAARKSQLLAGSTIATVSRYGGELAGCKAATKITGVDCGPCRPPLSSPDDQQLELLRGELDSIGFLATVGR